MASSYKPEDVAYLAGLYEGEGTFWLERFYWVKGEKRVRQTPQPRLRIVMTDVEPLERIHLTFGGNLHGPYRNGKDEYKRVYIWSVQSQVKVKELKELMWPWLSPRRRKQLEMYHAFQE